jgi:hypothetical protein
VASLIDQLQGANLVRTAVDDPDRYIAVNPEVASTRTLAALEEEAARHQNRIAGVRMEFQRLVTDYEQAKTGRQRGPSADLISDVGNVRAFLADIGEMARTRAWSLNPGNRTSEAGLAAALPLDLVALGRGVELRSVFQRSAMTHSATRRYIAEISEAGAQVRMTARIPFRLSLIDGYLLCATESGERGAKVYDNEDIVSLGESFFRFIWDSSVSVDAGVEGTGEDVDDLSRAILLSLAVGKKDDAVARDLSVSVRTMRRNMAMLMTRLKADTRFQAGVNAARRGWV